MSQCSPQDKNEIQPRLNKITTNFADVEEMAKLRLEELNKERGKAEDYEKQAADLDDWLKDKEAMVEQWEEFAIDSATLEQQMEKIGVIDNTMKLVSLYGPYIHQCLYRLSCMCCAHMISVTIVNCYWHWVTTLDKFCCNIFNMCLLRGEILHVLVFSSVMT